MSTNLPYIYASIECGHCCGELEPGDEGWTCHSCDLYWPDPSPFADVAPVFLDEEMEPCGHDGGRNERGHSGLRFWDEPCNLPAGHASSHHHPIGHSLLRSAETPD